jgi:hypothetical protein
MRQQGSQRLQRPNAAAAQNAQAYQAGMARRRHVSVLTRIKYALHRRGIYW